MAATTSIEWTDATWNPITGCSVLSAGCKHCYAMKLAGTRMKHHASRIGLTVETKAGPVWNGEVRFNGEWLDQPLRWAKPRDIFVCAHSDLFHEAVPDSWIDRVFAVMALAPQHRFQVLTKRADRMLAYLDGLDLDGGIGRVARLSYAMGAIEQASGRKLGGARIVGHHLRNVWVGVSVEDQAAAEARIPLLLKANARVRFVSAEPLLGPIDLSPWLCRGCPGCGSHDCWGLDWVILGGESGIGSRPLNPAWARRVRDDCARAETPFLFKQWGDFLPEGQLDATGFQWAPGADGKAHWWVPEPAFGQPLPDGACSIRIGKKKAGRSLDGRYHDGMPA